MLDDWTEIAMTDLFKLVPQATRPYEKPNNVWLCITVEMDLSLMTYERTVYTMFDLLSDVGGLQGIMFYLFASLAAAWNFNRFDNMMIASLFKI